MFEKLEEINNRYTEIHRLLSDPATVSDLSLYRSLNKELKGLSPIIDKYALYTAMYREFSDAKEILADSGCDAELRAIADEQFFEAKEAMQNLEEQLKILLLPKNPDDDRNVIIEIRAGVGGEEAALFAHSLYRMYGMYAVANGYKVEIMDENPTELGGYKEVSFLISGDGVYAKLKYESGAHRVQRVPETEAGGRIHTSAVTVAVLPEAEETDVEINDNDLTITACRSSGAGGQHINKTSSAIRIVHNPTGIAVECQEERSQFKNKDRAMKMLYTKLYDLKHAEETGKISEQRRIQVGTGDRSERIRTYNFPQGRVTDHRIGLTLYKLDAFMDGICDEVFDSLRIAEELEKLKRN
ncbi:MAG: peptide chain release factor 1 [Oscillospiraceae bacterium]|jgi:peptide chain release factor 1|nr:peptide chain release factor 1 [Oscillospiraceae bacterium]